MAWIGPHKAVLHYLAVVGADRGDDGRFIISGEPVVTGLGGDELVVPDGTVYFSNGHPLNLAAGLSSTSQGVGGIGVFDTGPGYKANPSENFHQAQFNNQMTAARAYVELALRHMHDVVGSQKHVETQAQSDQAVRLLSSAECSLHMAQWEANYGWPHGPERAKRVSEVGKILKRVRDLSPLEDALTLAVSNPQSAKQYASEVRDLRKQFYSDKV